MLKCTIWTDTIDYFYDHFTFFVLLYSHCYMKQSFLSFWSEFNWNDINGVKLIWKDTFNWVELNWMDLVWVAHLAVFVTEYWFKTWNEIENEIEFTITEYLQNILHKAMVKQLQKYYSFLKFSKCILRQHYVILWNEFAPEVTLNRIKCPHF